MTTPLRNPPMSRVQQDASGGSRRPQGLDESSPYAIATGVDSSRLLGAAHGSPVPPIGAFRGAQPRIRTGVCIRNSLESLFHKEGLRVWQCTWITGKLLFAGATHPNAQRGEAPLRSLLSPKIEDPTQEEWGTKGVDSENRDRGGGFRFALPALHVDSRPCGNGVA